MLISPLSNNTTYRINRTTAAGAHELIGYVFASSGSQPLVDQEQRWILFEPYFQMLRELKAGARAEDAIRIREPIVEQRYTSLAAWTEALNNGALWQPGARYVKVNAKNYSRIPQPIEAPPTPPYSSGSVSAQALRPSTQLIDDMVASIYRMDESDNATIQGFAGGGVLGPDRGTGASANVEYWITRDHYVSQLGAGVSKLRLEIAWKPGMGQTFVLGKWAEGSTFTVATCVYLQSLPELL